MLPLMKGSEAFEIREQSSVLRGIARHHHGLDGAFFDEKRRRIYVM